jgi:hypothetical protein
VSYRRDDVKDTAGRLADRVARWWSVSKVFIDVEAIGPGTDYQKKITDDLAECDVLLAVIGPNWLPVADKSGTPRLEDPEDLLVFEIETALKRGIIVVPVLVDNAQVPARENLPLSIGQLFQRQTATLNYRSFSRDVQDLRRAVEALVRGVRPQSHKSRVAGAFITLSGILLVFAALRFSAIARALTGVDQVADAVAAATLGILGLLLMVSPAWSGAAWEASGGVLLGVSPFVATWMWWSAQLRGATPPYYVESPLWMMLRRLLSC